MLLINSGKIFTLLVLATSLNGPAFGDCQPGIKDNAKLLRESSKFALEAFLTQMPAKAPKIQVETYPELKGDINDWAREQWSLAQKGCIRIAILKRRFIMFLGVPEILLQKKTILQANIQEANDLFSNFARRGLKHSLDDAIFSTLHHLNNAYSANIEELDKHKNATADSTFLRSYMAIAALVAGTMIALLFWMLMKGLFYSYSSQSPSST